MISDKQLKIIKLGGSLITNKSKEYSENGEVIIRLLKELSQARNLSPEADFILTHGSGSFAHTSAHEFGVKAGYKSDESLLHCSIVQRDSEIIATIVKNHGIDAGLPLLSLNPTSCFIKTKKGLVFEHETIHKALEYGFTPHLWGAMILDEIQRFGILSADVILPALAEYFKGFYSTVEMVHVGNYPGVWNENKKVIPLINKDNWVEVQSALTISDTKDVTGGMKLKVEELIKAAQLGIDSRIIDGTVKDNLLKALTNSESFGSGTHICWS